VRDGAGRAAGFVVIVRDITDVVAHERELARVEQRSRFGELAAGLAHEIKNPLAGIQGAVDILLARRAAHDPERAVLEGVRREVGRIDATVQTLLDRARPRALNVEPTALAEVLQRAVTLARHHADGLAARGGQRVRLAFEPHAEGLVAAVDAAQIEDAVLSLILNAVDAVDGDGEVVVRLKRTGVDAPPAEALIEVADTGRGIPADQLARIFTPFFTTHPNGTGLGLPAVRRIAQAHRGRVEVASTVGHGSVFTLRLPMN
jgi:signal transduction histidine kinase